MESNDILMIQVFVLFCNNTICRLKNLENIYIKGQNIKPFQQSDTNISKNSLEFLKALKTIAYTLISCKVLK